MPRSADHAALYLLVLVLPICALIARRVPLIRMVMMLTTWAALFAVLFLLIQQRGHFDPYLSRITRSLGLSAQQVIGREVRIRMSPDGHFWATATISGVKRRMLIDSGATITALSTSTVAAVGIRTQRPIFPLIIQTANGQISAETATIAELKLGNVVARDLPVVVSATFGETDILGMNFLSRLQSWRVEGSTLILQPHHPQHLT